MLLDEEGLPAVFHRHARHAEATRRAVAGWGLEVLCADPREYSNSLTAVARARRVTTPTGCARSSSTAFDMSLGTGLGKLQGKIFRIGHLGHFNDLMLCGTCAASRWGCTAPASRTAPAASPRRSNFSAPRRRKSH